MAYNHPIMANLSSLSLHIKFHMKVWGEMVRKARLEKIGPWGLELIWYLATKYKMGRQHVAPEVYHHLNHDKWGWDGHGITDVTWQS